MVASNVNTAEKQPEMDIKEQKWPSRPSDMGGGGGGGGSGGQSQSDQPTYVKCICTTDRLGGKRSMRDGRFYGYFTQMTLYSANISYLNM